MTELKIMKAASECVTLAEVKTLKFPKLVSFKRDGIRCLIKDGKIYAASMKNSLRNEHLKEMLAEALIDKYLIFDGELYAHGETFQSHMSVMSYEDPLPSSMKYEIFDCISRSDWGKGTPSFTDRLYEAKQNVKIIQSPKIVLCKHFLCKTPQEITDLYDESIAEGYEGLILRDPDAEYKNGRATRKSEVMLKIKAWDETDAEVVDFEEMYGIKATAIRKVDVTGHKEKVHKLADLEPKGTLGALIVRLEDGRELKVGTWKGLTQDTRQEIWDNRKKYRGRWVRFKSQVQGVKDLPRIPKDLQFRDDK